MAAPSVVDSWSVHHGLYAAIEPRVALKFPYDADRHKIARQILRIRNESGSEHITYKIKTTGPDKFKVQPCTGVIAFGGAEAQVEIQPSLAMSPDVALFNEERFLVCTMPIAAIPASQEELLSLWSDHVASADADTHIIAVAIDPLSPKQDGCHSNRDPVDSILQDALLHDFDVPSHRQEQLRRDDQLLGVVDACRNRSSRPPSISPRDMEDCSPIDLGPRSSPAGDSPSIRPYARPYVDHAARCDAPCLYEGDVAARAPVYADDGDWPVPFSRSLGLALIVALSIFAWWGFHSVTEEPPTTMIQWILRKIGLNYFFSNSQFFTAFYLGW